MYGNIADQINGVLYDNNDKPQHLMYGNNNGMR